LNIDGLDELSPYSNQAPAGTFLNKNEYKIFIILIQAT
jgi:hypothetical protein